MELKSSDTRRSTLSTVVVMACTAASRLFGFVRQALISYYFGGSGSADAMNAVFNVPTTLRKLFAEGAFSSAFIPVLSTTLEQDRSGARARELVRTLVAFQLIIMVPLVAVSLVFPRALVLALTNFPDPAKVDMAVRLMRWMFNYILFVSLGAVAMAVLNTHGRFSVPALAPLLFTFPAVLSIVLFHDQLDVVAQGVGVFVGGILQLACMLPSLRRLGYRFTPSFKLRNPDFTRTARLWVPYLASASIVSLNQLIAQYFASGLGNGSSTALSNAIMFFQIPIGIFTASVATVTFPTMSRQAAQEDREGLRRTVSYGIQALLVLLVPSTVLLCMFGREIIAAAIQRGKFGSPDTLMAYRVLIGYSLGLVSMGIYTFLQRLFNSYKSVWVPLVSAAVIAVLDVALSLYLKETALKVSGLAYANTIACTVGMAMLLILARRRLGGIRLGPVMATLVKACLGSLPMAVILFLFLRWKRDLWLSGGSLAATGQILAVCLLCVAVTLLSYAGLRIPFLADLLRRRRKE
jgi:putative peptidoglycan lipid II flippase